MPVSDTQSQPPLRKVPSWLLVGVMVGLFAGASWLAERWRTQKLHGLIADVAQLDVEIVHAELIRLVQGRQTGSITTSFELQSAGPFPATMPCGESFTLNGEMLRATPIWAAVGFDGDDELWHSYDIELNDVEAGTEIIVRAYGDLDCDGVHSTFLRTAVVSNGEVTGTNATFIRQQLE